MNLDEEFVQTPLFMGWPARGKKNPYHRITCFAPWEILPLIDRVNSFEFMPGIRIDVTNTRMRTFKNNTACVRCGLRGVFFALEGHKTHSSSSDLHLNFYGLHAETGREVMMTRDHILPKSKGGGNNQDNYQTMCERCNSKKGNRLSDPVLFKHLGKDIRQSLMTYFEPHELTGSDLRPLLRVQEKIKEEANRRKNRVKAAKKRERRNIRRLAELIGGSMEDQFLLAA